MLRHALMGDLSQSGKIELNASQFVWRDLVRTARQRQPADRALGAARRDGQTVTQTSFLCGFPEIRCFRE
jgi:hypothetical protein